MNVRTHLALLVGACRSGLVPVRVPECMGTSTDKGVHALSRATAQARARHGVSAVWGEVKFGLQKSRPPPQRHLGGGGYALARDFFTVERLRTALRVPWRVHDESSPRGLLKLALARFGRARRKNGRMDIKSGDILRKTLSGVKNVNVFC